MLDKSVQLSVEDLQQIQLHLEGQEQALAAIAAHLRAFETDAGQFTDFQRDFIKTIGLIQDVHQYTKQHVQQWREQLGQCMTVYQDTLRVQTEVAPQFTASADHLLNELQTRLQQQQRYFDQLKSVMLEHENLLSKHQSADWLKKVPDLMRQMTQQLHDTLAQVDAVVAGLSKLERQQSRQAEQSAATMSAQFADMQLLLNQHQKQQDQQDENRQAIAQHQLDQRFSDLSNTVQQALAQLHQDQANHRTQQQRMLRAGLSFGALLLLIIIFF